MDALPGDPLMPRPKGPPSQAILIWIPIKLYEDLKIERRETGKFDTLPELIRNILEKHVKTYKARKVSSGQHRERP
jgi:hypothetical protein